MGKLRDGARAEIRLEREPVWDGLDPTRDLVEAGVTNIPDGGVWPHHTRPALALTRQPASEGSPPSGRRTISEWPLSQLSLKTWNRKVNVSKKSLTA